MEPSRPNYLRAAFFNVYNLSLATGALAAALATGDYVLGAVGLGLEALWLVFAPDTAAFRRLADRWHRAEWEASEKKRLTRLMENLPEREWARAKALDQLRQDILRDMQHNPSFQNILIQSEVDKLSQLWGSFVTLATTAVRGTTYLSATNPKELADERARQEKLAAGTADPAAKEIAQKNVEVLKRRQSTIQEIHNFITRATGQMTLIENSIRLLRDQVLTMSNPEQLNEQLDDLLVGVEAVQATARDHEAILAKIDIEPIAPVGEQDRSRVQTRVR